MDVLFCANLHVSKAADAKRLFAETKRAIGKLDVLVNNAGVYQFAPLAKSQKNSLALVQI